MNLPHDAKYSNRVNEIKYLVLHSTEGKNSKNWLARFNTKVPKSTQNQVSIHYLVDRDGIIYKIIAEEHAAWHAGRSVMPEGETGVVETTAPDGSPAILGVGNDLSIGVEIEHMQGEVYPEVQLNAAAELTADIIIRNNLPGKYVVSHASIAKGRKFDPTNFDWSDFWNRVFKFLPQAMVDAAKGTGDIGAVEVIAPPPANPIDTVEDSKSPAYPSSVLPYHADSAWCGIPAIDKQKFIEKIASRPNKNYSSEDLKLIASYYIQYGEKIGIDYVLAMAQAIHETGWFSSYWSARPRRNPAGLGVSGIPGKGMSFPTWEHAVRAHLAHLLQYVYTDQEMTAEQLEFMKNDSRSIPKSYRGKAKAVRGLNGRWAVPGTTYANKIAAIANSLLK